MTKEIFLDANILFAWGQDPKLELYGKVVDELLEEMKEKGVKPCISATVLTEFEKTSDEKYGEIARILQDMFRSAKSLPLQHSLITFFESLVITIREKIVKSKILDLIELHAIEKIRQEKEKIQDEKTLLRVLLREFAPVDADFHRKYRILRDMCEEKKLVANKSDITDVEKELKHLDIDTLDSEHLACIYVCYKNHNYPVIFVTIDGKILAKKRAIENKYKPLIISSPLYVSEKIFSNKK